jgi:hypothetical protein
MSTTTIKTKNIKIENLANSHREIIITPRMESGMGSSTEKGYTEDTFSGKI